MNQTNYSECVECRCLYICSHGFAAGVLKALNLYEVVFGYGWRSICKEIEERIRLLTQTIIALVEEDRLLGSVGISGYRH